MVASPSLRIWADLNMLHVALGEGLRYRTGRVKAYIRVLVLTQVYGEGVGI